MKKEIILQWIRIIVGLFISSFGAAMTLYANIGVAPWDCLGLGVAKQTPLSYGLAMVIIAVLVLFVDILLRERIGFGTIFDALLLGTFVQFYLDINPFPENHSQLKGVIIMLIGTFIVSIGMWLYMSAGQCCGAKDALMVAIGRRFPKVPIGAVGVVIWVVVLTTGWLLGGPVGIGTLIGVFGSGIIMQTTFSILHFEPRDVEHKDVVEVTKALLDK